MQLQLNRGERHHQLARRLFFANQGAFQIGDYEEIMNKATCLSLLSNAAVVWNTVQMTRSPAVQEPYRKFSGVCGWRANYAKRKWENKDSRD
jgi:TnpA family transposase